MRLLDEPYVNDDGQIVRICGDCYIERALEDFIRDGDEHAVCNYCSPPAEIPGGEYNRRLVEGHRILGTEND